MTFRKSISGLYLPMVRHAQKVPHQQASSQQMMLAQRIAGGGAPGWVDAVDQADTNTDLVSDNALVLADIIFANQAGMVTKMRIYSGETAGGGVKVKIYDSSWNELGGGAGTIPDFTSGYAEIVLDGGGFPCSNGQELRAAYIAESSAAIFRYKDGEPANSSYYSFGYTYAGGLPSTFVPDGGLARKFATGLYL